MTEHLFNKIVQIYADRLYRYIIKLGVPPQESNDIMQNCYEALWKTTLSTEMECGKYLFGVAYNQCMNYWRIAKREPVFEQKNEMNFGENTSLLKIAINKGLNLLSEQQRSLILLKDYEGYSYQEIEEIMHLDAQQVKVYLHRARKKMQAYIGNIHNLI